MTSFRPTLFWLTGLSGAGKTTIGTLLADKLRARNNPVIFFDGDTLREIFNSQFGHEREARFNASMQYARLCKMLVGEQVHVVCSTISMFHQTQEWNRAHIENYLEILIDVPLDELIERDNKRIYSRAKSGELKNIVGIDIQPEFPKQPDLVIYNSATSTPDDNVNIILDTYDSKILA